MVKLEEVLDEEFVRDQTAPLDGEDDWDTDSESGASDVSDEDDIAGDETILERIAALQDIIPPSYRRSITNTVSGAYSWGVSGLQFGGKALWVVSTSAMLLGVPWALAYANEQQMVEMEREMKMQQSGHDLLTGNGQNPAGQPAGQTESQGQ